MRDKQQEAVSDIHHSALQIAALSHLCSSNHRVGSGWLLQMKYSAERVLLKIKELEEQQ